MDYSKRLNMLEMFQDPPEYKPPGTAIELASSVDYPNMNSQQYRQTCQPLPNVLHPCLEVAARNSEGQVVVAANDYAGRRWGSSFYGWECAGDVLDNAKAIFRCQFRYSITALRFTKDPNLFLLGSDKGSVELWSTRNAARAEGYSLYQVDGQTEHIEGVSTMDLLKEEDNKLVTGSNDGCLKVWTYGADLASISTMALAHTDEISGVSSSHTEESTFATCSLDRSALLWDLRKPRSASTLFEKHPFAFSAIYWTSKQEANEIIALGDVAGGLYFVDTRQPKVFLNSVPKVFKNKIHKISFNGSKFVVLGNTNCAKFFNGDLDLLHECTPAPNYLRDVLWDEPSATTCWLMGWDSFFKRIEF